MSKATRARLIETLIVGSVAGIIHNYIMYKRLIEFLAIRDLEMHELHKADMSLLNILNPIVEYLFQQEIDEEFESIVEENLDDLG